MKEEKTDEIENKEDMQNEQNKTIKHKRGHLKIILLIIFVIASATAITILAILLADKISVIDELESNNQKYQTNIKNLDIDINNKNSKIAELEGKVKELSQEDKIKELEKNKKDLDSEVSELEEQKTSLKKEIDELKDDVIKIKGEPKKYPAGHLEAGTDVPVGKYRIYGGSSNFIVDSASGRNKVNIILGNDPSWGEVEEYIYKFEKGDQIDARSSFMIEEVE